MKYVEAPAKWTPIENEKSVFLAGGITGCAPWQNELISKLTHWDVTVLNPRRKDFDVSNSYAAEEQITWEFNALKRATMVSFWFAAETLQPIALYELGRWAALEKEEDGWEPFTRRATLGPIVGCHPDYPRRQDVIIQMRLARPDIRVVDSLDVLAGLIIQNLKLKVSL